MDNDITDAKVTKEDVRHPASPTGIGMAGADIGTRSTKDTDLDDLPTTPAESITGIPGTGRVEVFRDHTALDHLIRVSVGAVRLASLQVVGLKDHAGDT